MKLYLYNGLDENGKATYQRIEIDEADADRWVQIDYEKRKLEEGDDASPRTAQQIIDEVNNDNYNSDRRYWYMLDKIQTVKTEDGESGAEEVSRIDLIPDDTYSPEKIFGNQESQRESEAILTELFASITDIQERRARAYFETHKTVREIANEEGVDFSSIRDSINAVRKTLEKIQEKFR